MTWRTALWLAFRGGRSDRLRIVLTSGATAVATVLLLLAAVVLTPAGPDHAPYANPVLWTERGLAGGTALALVLVCLPFLAFAGQCSRIGAPARERRFEDLARLGATSADLRRLGALESGVASVVGVVIGVLLYGLLAVVIASIGASVPIIPDLEFDAVGYRWSPDAYLLPTDRMPAWWVALPVLVLLPALVTLVSSAGTTPGGRRTVAARSLPRPSARSVVLVVGGLATYGAAIGIGHFLLPEHSWIFPALALVALVIFTAGATGLTRPVGIALGGRLAAVTDRPDLLLAGRRMVAQHRPSGSRVTLILGCVVGGAALVVRASTVEMVAEQGDYGGFKTQTYALLLVALVIGMAGSALGLLVGELEGVVEGRRSLATAAAAGVPRGVIARAVVVEAVLPVLPTTLVATAIGAATASMYRVAFDNAPGAPLPSLVAFVLAVWLVVVAAAGLATFALPASTDVSEARVPA